MNTTELKGNWNEQKAKLKRIFGAILTALGIGG
jgi:truncated hemoglobin YjbI